MSRTLTSSQIAPLRAALEQRVRELQARLAAHQQGVGCAEHAHEVLGQDAGDAAQREGERELDIALTDLETVELAQARAALARLAAGGYGRCADCGADIAFERLKAEPWALRCVGCAAAAEAGTARRR